MQSATKSIRRTAVDEMEHWFFGIYLPAWVDLGASESGEDRVILAYWGFPLHAASVNMTRCLMTGDEVIGFNENAGAVDVIWSRRRADQSEIERRAVHFEILDFGRPQRSASSWLLSLSSPDRKAWSTTSPLASAVTKWRSSFGLGVRIGVGGEVSHRNASMTGSFTAEARCQTVMRSQLRHAALLDEGRSIRP